MEEEVKERLKKLTASSIVGADIKAALERIDELEIKSEALGLVLAAMTQKVGVSQKKIMELLKETAIDITKKK